MVLTRRTGTEASHIARRLLGDTPLGFGKVGHCSAKMHGHAGLSVHLTNDDGHSPIEKWNATFRLFSYALSSLGVWLI